ncbi:MAG: hypothetical protein ABFS46_08500 [Myxococcota bacterium]
MRSRWLQVLVLGAITTLVVLQYGPAVHPLIEDRAFFVYLGQQILRGEPIYQTSFMGYPPLGPLASAATMVVGGVLGLPTYLAPRLGGIAAMVFCVILLSLFVRRALTSPWAGALAGLVLLSFAQLGRFSVGTLEPKTLVVALEIATFLALQRRRWGAAGLASAFAASAWQPAALLSVVSFAVVLYGGRRQLRPAVRRFATGVAIATLPTVLYVTLTESWIEFLQRCIVIHLDWRAPALGESPLGWIRGSLRDYANERLFLGVALVSFAVFAIRSLRRPALGYWVHPRLGGVPLATAVWAIWNTVEFTGPLDLFTLLPLVAFWVAWGAWRAVVTLGRRLPRGPVRSRVLGSVVALGLVGTALYGAADAFLYEPAITLDEQRAAVEEIRATAEGPVMGFGAEEFYALTQTRSPLPFVHLNVVFEPFVSLVEPAGCSGLLRRILEARAVVIVDENIYQGPCARGIGHRLVARGYQMRSIGFDKREHWHFRSRPEDVQRLTWHVYRPKPRP